MPTFEAKKAPAYLLVVAGVKWVLWPKSHWNFRSNSGVLGALPVIGQLCVIEQNRVVSFEFARV